jgi:hypothetical protein
MFKKIFKIVFRILLFLPFIAAAHFFVFPQETRCMLIGFSNFKKQQNIYYRNDVSAGTVQQLLHLKTIAEKKVQAFWKDSRYINYKLIYCNSDVDYNKYEREGALPGVANLKMGVYVIIPGNMHDVNILSHAVLYKKIGWYNLYFKIPAWFDEGLAMQVDDRDYYSIDTLLHKRNAGLILPDSFTLVH